jgi:hypothetical protein
MNSYTCPLLKIDFHVPCDIKSCKAHIARFLDVGLKPKNETNTNCINIEFENLFDEQIDYAIAEQGRVGYRDLDYVSDYFDTNPTIFRNLYEAQDRYLRQSYIVLALLSKVEGMSTDNPFRENAPRNVVERVLLPSIFMLDHIPREKLLDVAYYDFKNKKMLFSQTDLVELKGALS